MDPEQPWGRRLDIALANALPILVVLGYAIWEAAVRDKGIGLGRGSVSAQARDVLWFSLICGFASYATIETLKRVVRVRGWYQLWQTKKWLMPGAYEELLRALGLRRDDEVVRVFNLPTEQLAAQIGAGADVALTGPRRYRSLLATLAAPLPEALSAYLEEESSEGPAGLDPSERSDRKRDLRLQLAQQTRLGIDRLQISLGEQWRRTVQGAALWIAGLYGIGLAHAADLADEPRYLFAALLLGGPIAWILRDLAAVVERARR